MKRHVREDLTEVFGLWLDRQQARSAAEEVRAAEQMLEAYPAPLPESKMLNQIKLQMQAKALHRRRMGHLIQGVAAVAAVIMIVVGLSGHNFRRTSDRPGLASLIPAGLWESDDVAADDVKLAYLSSEVDRLEAQVQGIENSDTDTGGTGALNEVEMELFQIDTDFWKG
jgi:hypothetical protein